MRSFEVITSKDNEIIKTASLLVSSAKFRKEKRQFVLDGLRLCRDAVLNGFEVDCLIVGETAYQKFIKEADAFLASSKRAVIVPDRLIEKISDTVNPQGFIMICSIKADTQNSELNKGKYIALENIADPSNLGAISRSAEAFGFNGIIVSSNGCDPYNHKALRASMGALLRIPVYCENNLALFLKNSSLTSYACVVNSNAAKLNVVTFEDNAVCVIGNEANGLTEDAISSCDNNITIPMIGKAESLNAATAAAIVMWEMSK